jgi:hypothetical protein
MGTVETIVGAMLKMNQDKKALATARYEDHSAWLSREFDLIRELVNQESSQGALTSRKSSLDAKKHVTAPSSGAHLAKKGGGKRKSPEFAVGLEAPSQGTSQCSVLAPVAGARGSPAMKRPSPVDFSAALEAAGLPADLNKMKKDRLLQEIETRGGMDGVTMKSLKKDMVGALEKLLMREAVKAAAVTASQSPKENRGAKMNVAHCSLTGAVQKKVMKDTTTPPTMAMISPDAKSVTSSTGSAASKSSLASFRNQLRNDAPKETDDERNKRTTEAYEARQMRHRTSQARKSGVDPANLMQSPPSSATKASTTPSPASVPMEEASPMPQSPIVKPSSTSKMTLEPTNSAPGTPEQPELGEEEREMEAQDDEEDEEPEAVEVSGEEFIEAAVEIEETQASAPVEEKPKHVPSPVAVKVEMIKKEELVVVAKEPVVEEEPVVVEAEVSKVAEMAKVFEAKNEELKKGVIAKAAVAAPGAKVLTKWDRLASGKPAKETDKMGDKTAKPKGGLFGFMKSAKLLLSGQKAPKEEKEDAKKKEVKKDADAPGPTTIADLRAMLAAEATKAEEESPEPSPVKVQPEQQQMPLSVMTDLKSSTTEKKFSVESSANETFKSAESFTTAKSDSQASASSQGSSTSSVVEMVAPTVASFAPAPAAAPIAAPIVAASMPQPPQGQGNDEYHMDDRNSSGSSDSGSGTDDESSRKNKKQKQIPDWARGAQLKEALEKQYGLNGHTPIDPDTIFPEVESCDLEQIFGKKEGKFGKYSKRTSSAKWDADELTLVEKRTYRTQMGF